MKKFIRQCVQFFDSWCSLLFIIIVMGLIDIIVDSTLFTHPLKICLCMVIAIVQVIGIIFMIMGAYESRKDLSVLSWIYIVSLVLLLIVSFYVDILEIYSLLV